MGKYGNSLGPIHQAVLALAARTNMRRLSVTTIAQEIGRDQYTTRRSLLALVPDFGDIDRDVLVVNDPGFRVGLTIMEIRRCQSTQ